ncbi:hypothetical protein BAE44_0024105 [Dichanthelium oligosanthes]|uniref:Eukaryotic translation initiation factor 3 subunit G N-terminal domain-containing protein n=1 Tax=Dichanthelium oligosanthes TaxID=888268 RepID=A0A1E5UPT7_9POAL|nr:hypothetical protein BAE44_0024105 [Dichanthelium oligosanthes]
MEEAALLQQRKVWWEISRRRTAVTSASSSRCGSSSDPTRTAPTKKVIEYHFDDKGNKVEVTATTLARKFVRACCCRSVIERRWWRKFGDAVDEDAGSWLTMHSLRDARVLIRELKILIIIREVKKRYARYERPPNTGKCKFSHETNIRMSNVDILFYFILFV